MFKALCSVKTVLALCFFALSPSVLADLNDLDYLPDNQNYNPNVPKPSDVLGYPVGTWHVRHDQLVKYMEVLAESSDRVTLTMTGKTHEHRDLVLLTITDKSNHDNIDEIKATHISRIKNGDSAASNDPLVIYMGYSVHGNEPSGSNASMLIAYHLAASQSNEVKQLLRDNIVLVDPSLNPDGLSRFAQWANMHKGKNLVTDPMHREHREAWPSGRTNHYWFDLNRDWLLLTHPESRARIHQFHTWRPHILTDFHEMGTNSTFFFQPGVPSRKNPWTPNQNVTLTNALGDFHAKALDDDKQLYFTQESFDDFYYGKGSTYPDAHGSIGILFEQASSRGHAQESINGVVTFPKSIQNQVTTSLSTFAGAMANKAAILAYQRQFYNDTKKLIKDDKYTGFLVAGGADKTRFNRLVSILEQHQIGVDTLTKSVTVNDVEFEANNSAFIKLDQNQYRLIKSLFSERQRFADNTFYDVSNWNIALAFNLDYAQVKNSVSRKLSLNDWQADSVAMTAINEKAYAYAFEWFNHNSPAMLQTLLEHGVQVRVAGSDFTASVDSGKQEFARGTVVIPKALKQPTNLIAILNNSAEQHNVALHTINSGLTSKGIDLGSRQFAKVDKPEVLLVGGKGTSSYEVGEIWHYLDTKVGVAATIWDLDDLSQRDLERYTHVIFASGRYNNVNERTISKIEDWLGNGGILVGQKSAVTWFSHNGWIDNKPVSRDALNAEFSTAGMKFSDQAALGAKKLVAGAVYESKIDLSHPMFFGFERDILPLFKTSNMVLQATDNPFEDIASYTDDPLMAGYSADEMQSLIKNTTAIVAVKRKRGVVIGFVDNVHFRGYWDGTNKLTANALYMTPLL